MTKNEASLKALLQTLDAVKQEAAVDMGSTNGMDLMEGLELRNLLTVGDIVARTVLMRTESRGPHFRTDFPQRDDGKWLKAIVVRNGDDHPELGTLVLDPDWKERPGDMGGRHWG